MDVFQTGTDFIDICSRYAIISYDTIANVHRIIPSFSVQACLICRFILDLRAVYYPKSASEQATAMSSVEFANPDVSGSFQALAKRSRLERDRRGESRERRPLQQFQVLDKPWYILAKHADELELDQDGQVRSGSLPGLIERLTSSVTFSNPNGESPVGLVN